MSYKSDPCLHKAHVCQIYTYSGRNVAGAFIEIGLITIIILEDWQISMPQRCCTLYRDPHIPPLRGFDYPIFYFPVLLRGIVMAIITISGIRRNTLWRISFKSETARYACLWFRLGKTFFLLFAHCQINITRRDTSMPQRKNIVIISVGNSLSMKIDIHFESKHICSIKNYDYL